MNPTHYLTPTQRHQLSHHKDIYLTLRSIYLLKIALASERITQQLYENQLNRLVKKYHLIAQLIPKFDLTQFCIDFDINECQVSPAMKEILIRKEKQQPQKNTNFLFMQITSTLIETLDSNETNIGETRLLFERLTNRLEAVKDYLSNEQFTVKVDRLKKKVTQLISDKPISQQLTEQQLEEIKLEVRAVYDALVCLTRK